MILNPPPIHEPWTVDPRTGKVNSPGWLQWFNELVTAGQMADEFAGTLAYQTTEGAGSTSSTRNDPVVTQDDIGTLIEAQEPTGVRSSKVDDDAMVFAMMSF